MASVAVLKGGYCQLPARPSSGRETPPALANSAQLHFYSISGAQMSKLWPFCSQPAAGTPGTTREEKNCLYHDPYWVSSKARKETVL